MGSFSRIKTIIDEGEKFLLICHVKPDGDSIGAMLGLAEALCNIGKKADMVCKDPIPEFFSFLKHVDGIKNDFLAGEYDAIVLIDNGDLNRTGFAERIKLINQKQRPVINIDHHKKNDLWKLAAVNYSDESAPSATYLIFKILKGLKIPITPSIATYLSLGLFTDTGGFQHSNTTPEVFEMMSALLSHGAKFNLISNNIYYQKPVTSLKLWGMALKKLRHIEEYGLVYSVITKEDIQKLKASEDEVSGLVNLMASIPEARTALLIYETLDGNIKGSLRTEKNDIDVSILASLLGGGGHKKAAGFTIPGELGSTGNSWLIN